MLLITCVLVHFSIYASQDGHIYAAIKDLQCRLDSFETFRVARIESFDMGEDVIAYVFYLDKDAGFFGTNDTIYPFFPNSFIEWDNRLYFWTSDETQKTKDMVVSQLREYGVVDDSIGLVVVCVRDELPTYFMSKKDPSIFIFRRTNNPCKNPKTKLWWRRREHLHKRE